MIEIDRCRRGAIKFWERRRIIYNLALVPPSLLAYVLSAAVVRSGDDFAWHPFRAVLLLGLSALGANLRYTFAYALEFLIGRGDSSSWWFRLGRSAASFTGLAVPLAFLGGRSIAILEFRLP
jgi:hypothetical protein